MSRFLGNRGCGGGEVDCGDSSGGGDRPSQSLSQVLNLIPS